VEFVVVVWLAKKVVQILGQHLHLVQIERICITATFVLIKRHRHWIVLFALHRDCEIDVVPRRIQRRVQVARRFVTENGFGGQTGLRLVQRFDRSERRSVRSEVELIAGRRLIRRVAWLKFGNLVDILAIQQILHQFLRRRFLITFMVVTIAKRIEIARSRFDLFLEILRVWQIDVDFAWSLRGLGQHRIVDQGPARGRGNASGRRDRHEFGRVRIQLRHVFLFFQNIRNLTVRLRRTDIFLIGFFSFDVVPLVF
jgi:hypothetical protein